MNILVFALFFAPGDTCTNCHEIAPTVQQWKNSSHRNVTCDNCHGGTFQPANVTRLRKHWKGEVPEQIRLSFVQVSEITQRCKSCHQGEYSAWSTGPHSSGFAKIFTDAKHNTKRHLMDDCFRCHGMFYQGAVRDVVGPMDTKGPWKLVKPALAEEPTMPCITCHAVHADGSPRVKGKTSEVHRPSLALWDRRAGEHIPLERLPVPVMKQADRVVKMSPDPRQALCYQCHAPVATMQAWSGDDRTPLGVHEGLSCLACHSKHTQDATASCANCHPRLSNCGLDVNKMDTTFKDPKSRHNIHTVACRDCHEKGVPQKKVTARLSAR